VLGLDTSTMTSTCAVIEDGKLLGEYSLSQDMSHSEKLVPMIKEVLDSLNLKTKDIDLYGVAIGPGSFTGLRIGIATMKSLAHLFDKPIVGVSTLKGLAYNLAYNDIVLPMIDARRDRVYTGIYSWEKENINEIMKPSVVPIEDLVNKLKEYDNISINGNGVEVYKKYLKENLKDKVRFSTVGQNICKASSIAELAEIEYKQGKVDNYYTLAPDYLRETQAERESNL